MKRLSFVLTTLILSAALVSCSSSGWMSDNSYDESYYGRRSNVNMDMFMRELSPFGQWVSMPRYGQVWVTNERGFRPYYSGGHWADTRYGYTWVSDYSWGWAPFHYGKWGYDPFYGWFWVPGYDWSPAWVNWRNSGSYYGWSPYMVNDAYSNPWIFSDQRYLTDRSFRERCLFGDQHPDIYRNSQPITRPRNNSTVYRTQPQDNNTMIDNDRRIYRDNNANNRNGFPQREVIERPSRFERPDVNRVERIERTVPGPPQVQPQGQQRAASDVIRNTEEKISRRELPQRERPAEIKRDQKREE